MTRKKDKLVFGWGVNDVDYPVQRYGEVDGKKKQIWVCPYYRKWKSMLGRCLYHKKQQSCPTYAGCTVHPEWKYLSNFIKWVDSQPNKDWMNCSLDKDFLVKGNKHYSPENAVFIPKTLNVFIIDSKKVRGDYMLGVIFQPEKRITNPYQAQCSDPFTGKRGYLGVYPTELEAHKAWQTKKHEYACMLADMQEDERVAKALRERYAPDKDWTNK